MSQDGEGARALDGGDPRLHPPHYRRRRHGQARPPPQRPAAPQPTPLYRPAAMPPRRPVPPSPPLPPRQAAAAHRLLVAAPPAPMHGSAQHRRHAGRARRAARRDCGSAGRDVLDLTEQMASPAGRIRDAELPDHRRPVRRDLQRCTAAAARPRAAARWPRAAAATPACAAIRAERRPRSTTTSCRPRPAAAVDSAFNTLAQSVLVQNAARSRTWSRKCSGPC